MGWSQSEVIRCKKHPKHKQSPGVCSHCLRERLSQLNNSSSSSSSASNKTASSSCSSSSSISSCSSVSSSSSPILFFSSNNIVDASGTRVLYPVKVKQGLFGRSRSVAVVVRDREGFVIEKKKKKKKQGFWSKLLRTNNGRRKGEEFLHSKTMKEAVTNGQA